MDSSVAVAKSIKALNHKDTKAQRKLLSSAGPSPEKLCVFVVRFFIYPTSCCFKHTDYSNITG